MLVASFKTLIAQPTQLYTTPKTTLQHIRVHIHSVFDGSNSRSYAHTDHLSVERLLSANKQNAKYKAAYSINFTNMCKLLAHMNTCMLSIYNIKRERERAKA